MNQPIPSEYEGWWRIIDTSQWVNDGLDDLGPAASPAGGLSEDLELLEERYGLGRGRLRR